MAEATWLQTQQAGRHKDGSVTQTFLAEGLDEIAWWLLGWSGRPEVVGLPELRAMAMQHLRIGLALNTPGESARG